MALAMHEGKIHLTLRNPEDADTLSNLASMSTNQLIGRENAPAAPTRAVSRGPSRPRPEPVRTVTVPAPPPEEPVKVTVIKAGKQQSQEPANDKN